MGVLWHLDPDVARLIAAQRRPKARSCDVCGTVFTTVGRGRYCSRAHKRRAERGRARERLKSLESDT